MSRVAVIDLGTNTFHILIADCHTGFSVLYKERKYVYLGEGGIDTITQPAAQRGLEALRAFNTVISEYDIEVVRAIGTAALRTSSNSGDFIRRIKKELDLDIEVISGVKEAELIAQGVGLLYKNPSNHLVMDIGGGSVEFIFGRANIQWRQSFNIGISVLYELFHRDDPLSKDSLIQINTYLDTQLAPLATFLKSQQSFDLIGAAGTFEVLLHSKQYEPHALSEIDVDYVRKFFNSVKHQTYSERLQNPLIPETRAKYIVVGLALVNYVLKHFQVENTYVSPYSMKEGVIAEYLDKAKK